MWNPWLPENLTEGVCIPWCWNASTSTWAAIFEYSSQVQSMSRTKSHPIRSVSRSCLGRDGFSWRGLSQSSSEQ